MNPALMQSIDRAWTLFLDRDGVLNQRIVDDYVRSWRDWEWNEGSLEALRYLTERFGRIVVVTNQRGIARGLYSEADLADIHARMRTDVVAAGGRMDAIYHCPHDKNEGCNCRKPKPGMLLQAMREHPGIDPKRSIMVGDSVSDMQAAHAAGIAGVFIGNLRLDLPPNVLTVLPDLRTFARLLEME